MYLESAHSATSSDHPQHFIYTKRGTLSPIKIPAGESPFAVWRYGRWCLVFSRMETDEEYFRNHPEMPFRLKLHRSPLFRRDYFTFEITTRNPEVYADGDKWDGLDELHRYPGTPRDKLIAACWRILTRSPRSWDQEAARQMQADWNYTLSSAGN